MGHEVFICYDDEDRITACAVCHYLEENGIKCWLKCRDSRIGHEVEETMDSIRKSDVMVLVFSEYSKISSHVNTEVNLAFNEQIPILGFKVEKTKLEGSLEYYLRNAHWLDAYPESDVKFRNLIKDTSKLLDKPVSDLVVSEKSKDLEIRSDEYISKRPKPKVGQGSLFDRFKIPIIVLMVILIVAVGAFAFMNFDDGMGGSSADEASLPNVTMKISDFHVDDVRKKDTAWNYSYIARGTIFPTPDDEGNYIITADFYDKAGKLVETVKTPLDEAQKVSDGYLFGSAVSDKNDIMRVEVQLINDKDIVVAQCGDKI